MTREAALLGVPTVSLFAGERPAVDRWLEDRGLLGRLEDIADLPPLEKSGVGPRPIDAIRRRSEVVTEQFLEAALGSAVTKREDVL
jgi:hypothetical protein